MHVCVSLCVNVNRQNSLPDVYKKTVINEQDKRDIHTSRRQNIEMLKFLLFQLHILETGYTETYICWLLLLRGKKNRFGRLW